MNYYYKYLASELGSFSGPMWSKLYSIEFDDMLQAVNYMMTHLREMELTNVKIDRPVIVDNELRAVCVPRLIK